MSKKDWLVKAHQDREKAEHIAQKIESVDKEFNRSKKKRKKNSKKWTIIFWIFVILLVFLYAVTSFLTGEIRFFDYRYKLPNTYNPMSDKEIPIEKLIDNWIDTENEEDTYDNIVEPTVEVEPENVEKPDAETTFVDDKNTEGDEWTISDYLKEKCDGIYLRYNYDTGSTYSGSGEYYLTRSMDDKTCEFYGRPSGKGEIRQATFIIEKYDEFWDDLFNGPIEKYDPTEVYDENGKLVTEVFEKAIFIREEGQYFGYLIKTPENVDEIEQRFIELYEAAQ